MKSDKMPNMVAEIDRRKPGRPRTLPEGSRTLQLKVPPYLRACIERLKKERQTDDCEAARMLLHDGAEARGLLPSK